MTTALTSTRPRLYPRLVLTLSSTLLLAAAFSALPGAVARISSPEGITTGALAETLGVAFSQWWSSSVPTLTPDMAAVVSFWGVFHATKAAIAVALLIALLLAGRELWRTYARVDGRAARAGIALLGIVGASAAPVVLLIVMANIQGAIAPLSSVMGLLPMDGSVAEVALVREQFAAGTTTPVLEALITDFRTYHLVLVLVAVAAAALVAVGDILLWIRWSRMPREQVRLRRVTAIVAGVLPSVVVFLLFVMVLNISTVADTAPALAAFFEGGL